MLKKLLAALGVLALVLGLVALVAGPASAHDHSVDASCPVGVSVNLTSYDTSHGDANHLSVTLDSQVVYSQSFSASVIQTFPWAAPAAGHSYTVAVTAWDHKANHDAWTFTQSGTLSNCEEGITPARVTWASAVCTGAGTVGDGSYTVPTNSTGVKGYEILVNGTWTTIAAKSYPAAAGTVVHIRATHLDGYKFTGTWSWDFTIGSADKSTCVAPPNPTPYVLAAWLMPSWSGDYHTPTWKPYQSFFAKTDLASKDPKNLNALDSQLTKCGTSYQVDLYNDSATTTALIAGGKLYGPNNPTEDFPSPTGWGVTYKLVHNPDCKDAIASVGVSTPTCQANGVATFTLTFATWSDTTGPDDQTVGNHTRTANAQVGHLFSNGLSSMDVSYTIPAKLTGNDCLTTVVPSASATPTVCDTSKPGTAKGSYTLAAIVGVIYSVKLNNGQYVVTAAGTYFANAGDTVHVLAVGDTAHGYRVDGAPSWTFAFSSTSDCLVQTPAGDPKFVDPSCDVATPGTIVAGTYTVILATHVSYTATVNGGASTPLTAGIGYPANPGDVVVITPIVEQGYVIAPAILAENLKHTFAAVNHDCFTKADFVKPAATSQSCVVTAGTTYQLTDAFITIPSLTVSPHVTYFIDNVATAPGDHVLKPGTYLVSAVAKTGYFLDGYNGPWTEVLTSAAPCGDLITHPLVAPSAVQVQLGCFTNGSYTLSNDLSDAAALIWTVNGSTVSQGTYKVTAPSTVVVHVATSGPSYGLETGAITDWTFHFVRPTSCDLTTLALTGSTPTGWIVFGYLMLVSGLALVAVRFARRREDQM